MSDPNSTGQTGRFEDSETLPPPIDPLAAELVSVTPGDARFDMIRLIAQGGEGEIWEAEQVSLGRVVAIKVLRRSETPARTESVAETRQRARGLCMEARLAAALEHPNIVPVHDLASNAAGQPMFAMKRVVGSSWAGLIANEWQNPDREAYLERHLGILCDVAQAVAFAHSRGIVHRDIKPSQVMIGEFGEVLLMDWGLAVSMPAHEADERWRARQNPVPPTIGFARNPGGTPAFMAPEQTSEDVRDIGPWTDVYLLGATLYYVLTGTPPHSRGTTEGSMSSAATNSYPPLAAATEFREFPDDLEDLMVAAMGTTPRSRPTAIEFLERLQGIRSGHPKRRRAAAIVEDVDGAVGGAATYGAFDALHAKLREARVLWPANPALEAAESRLATAHAEHALAAGDLSLAVLLAEALPNGSARDSLKGRTVAAVARHRRREAQRRFAFAGVVVLFALATFAALVAGGQKRRADEQLRQTQRAMDQARASENSANEARARAEREQYFAGVGSVDAHFRDSRPDLAFATLVDRMPPALRHWEWGALLARLAVDDMTLLTGEVAAASAVFHADWSRDGSKIATGHHGGRIAVWDATTGRRSGEWKLEGYKGFWCVRFDAQARRIAAASTNGKAVVIDARDGTVLARAELPASGHQRVMRGCDFSPDGRFFATTGEDEYLRLWDAETGAAVRATKLPSPTYDVRFSPDGATMLVGVLNEYKEAWLVSTATGETIRSLPGHSMSVLSVRFDAAGTKVLTASNDGKARIFDAASGELVREFSVSEARLRCADFSADGRLVAASGNDGMCRVWDAETGELLHRIVGAKQMEKVAFSPQGNLLLTVSFDEIRMWDLDRMTSPRLEPASAPSPVPDSADRVRLASFPYALNDVWYGYDDFYLEGIGRRVFATDGARYVVDSYYTVFDPRDRWRLKIDRKTSEARVFEGTSETAASDVLARAYAGAFSADGKWLALGTHDGEVAVFESGTWLERSRWRRAGEEKSAITAVSFSPDGRRLAVGSQAGRLAILEPSTGDLLRDMPEAHKRGKPTVGISWSRDGGMFVSASSDETARVWDGETGEPISILTGHGLNVLSAAFSPDGERILTTGMDNKAKIWETATGREIMNVLVLPPDESMMGGTFSQDGKRAFFATAGGRLHVVEALPWGEDDWDCAEGERFLRCLELRKRRAHRDANATEADIAWE